MLSPVEALLQQRIIEYDNMNPEEQRQKLEQILHVYANGDAIVVEGIKLTFHAIVSHNPRKMSSTWEMSSLDQSLV